MIEQRLKGTLAVLQLLQLLLTMAVLSVLIYIEYLYGWIGLSANVDWWLYLAAIPVSFLVVRRDFEAVLAQFQRSRLWVALKVSLRFVFALGCGFALVYLVQKDVAVSRRFLLMYLGVSFVFNFLYCYFAPRLVALVAFNEDNRIKTVLVSFGELPDDLRHYIKNSGVLGVQMIGYYSDTHLSLRGVEWMGTTDEYLQVEGGRKRVKADLTLAYSPHLHNPQLKEVVDKAARAGSRVQIYSDLSRFFQDPVRFIKEDSMDFITFSAEPLQNPINAFIKRMLDIVLSAAVCFTVLPPLTVAVWLIQRFQSPGPVFFKQLRYGVNRKPFVIFKYRSMYVSDGKDEARQATKGDKRIYPLGALLRKTSLDEFPQFWNVLKGDMSIVGPRPHLTTHDQQFEKIYRRYRARHYVKPGITGLAQVSGYRGEAQTEGAIVGRVERDLEYITSWTLSKELVIILKTAWQVFFPPKSAY